MHVLLHRVDQFAAGMVVDGAQLAVEAFKLHPTGGVPLPFYPVACAPASPAGSGCCSCFGA